MKPNERPILFSGKMVRAITKRRKTQTRRIVKATPIASGPSWNVWWSDKTEAQVNDRQFCAIECPYGKPGDRLWVRETWTGMWLGNGRMHLSYAADGSEREVIAPYLYVLPKAAVKVGNWVTPLFMPRWASRITLEITGVRVERLQDISEADAVAEGLRVQPGAPGANWPSTVNGYTGVNKGFFHVSRGHGPCVCNASRATPMPAPVCAYAELWSSINGPNSWKENPWVWVVEFKVAA